MAGGLSDLPQPGALRTRTPTRRNRGERGWHRRVARIGADIPTYYDLPPLKQSLYGWKVSAYIWVAGIAGSSQILATSAEFTDRDGLCRHYPKRTLYRAREDRWSGRRC